MLRNGHSMTIFAALYPRTFPPRDFERREVATSEDTRVVIKCEWQADKLERPTILLVHGLEGDSERHYMLGAGLKAWKRGMNVVRMNVRNCGGTEHLSPTLYHSGLTSDLGKLIDHLIEVDKLPAISIIGFSMGGNQALKLAGEYGANPPPQLKSVAAICPPIDLEACSRSIGQSQNFIYERRFLKSLKARLNEKVRMFNLNIDLNAALGVETLWDFDELVTAPAFGFDDARDYYARASSGPWLSSISVPALIIQAQDDPFIPFAPFTRLPSNEMLQLLAPEYGGHVGFWARREDGEDNYWAERMAVDFSLQCCSRV